MPKICPRDPTDERTVCIPTYFWHFDRGDMFVADCTYKEHRIV